MTIASQIAIDGPAGAGKSTVAKIIADRLGYLYIDTGAMYRAVGLLAIEKQVAFDDAAGLVKLIRENKIDLEPAPSGCQVFINGRDVSRDIRLPEVGNAASPVSAVPQVRSLLVEMQRQMAASRPVVMDGRDIGTVVLPEAGCKIFLTASTGVRARRRANELREKGLPADEAQVEQEIIQRDLRDSSRAASPLKQAEDAVLVDSSHMTVEQVVSRIISLAEGQAR